MPKITKIREINKQVCNLLVKYYTSVTYLYMFLC